MLKMNNGEMLDPAPPAEEVAATAPKKGAQKTRRGLTVYHQNPFVVAGIVRSKTKRLVNKKGGMMVIGETGEIVAPIAGFWQAQEVDDAKFVKLYINGVMAFTGTTNAGRRVFEVLFREVQKNIGKDRVYLSFTTLDESVKMSQATFTRGMRELIDQGFVAPTEAIAWYWLNLDFMFNGDRLAFIQEYRKKGGSFEDPRQQTLALEDDTTQVKLS